MLNLTMFYDIEFVKVTASQLMDKG